MPLYEYQCDSCAHRFERIQKFSDPLVEICPNCGGAVRKLLSSPAIQFKGSGWYITDYAKKPSSDGGAAAAGSKNGSGQASESGGSKTDAASPAPAASPSSGKTE
jgi:putative FmdB family regulatory protein